MASKKTTDTAFQVRMEGMGENVIDWTERRLERLSKSLPSKEEKEACSTLLGMYVSGTVAVKWCGSMGPRYVKIPGK